MGFLDKRKTAQRTADFRAPNILGDGDGDTRLEATDLALRDIAASVGGVARSSSALRGSTPALATLFGIGDVSSDFWFERTDHAEWQLTLGAATTRGVAIDWSVRCVAITPATGPALLVSTVSALTRDGALVKGDEHDAMRAAIADAVSTGRGAATGSTQEVSAAGLAVLQTPWGDPPSRVDDRFVVTSTMSRADVEERLPFAAGRVRRDGSTWTYEMGIVGQTAAFAVVDTADPASMTVTVSCSPTGILAADVVAVRCALRFRKDIVDTLKLWDGNAEIAANEVV